MTVLNRTGRGAFAAALGLLCTLPAAQTTFADDTEIYATAAAPNASINPNILLIIDTSGSMGTEDIFNERATYRPTGNYATRDNCTAGRIFFRLGGEAIPDCTSTNFIEATTNNCQRLAQASAGIAGRWTGKAAQWDTESSTWRALRPAGGELECAADDGIHGSNASPTGATHAQNGVASDKWTSTGENTINWSQLATYTFYSAHWLNWRRVTPRNTTLSRLQAMKNAVTDLASSLDSVNIGMMRFADPDLNRGDDNVRNGGIVTNPIEDINVNRMALIADVNNFFSQSFTPLAESLHEAKRYWAGNSIMFGGGSVDSARVSPGGSDYKSPITHQCQRNFTVMLTDGRPTADSENDDEIAALTGRACDADNIGEVDPPFGEAADGQCLDDLAGYLSATNTDLSALPGNQNVSTYTIGFGRDLAGAAFLSEVATAGRGRRFDAGNTEELTEAFAEITNDILNVSSTFATATVGVNAFNRAASRDDVYFAVFSGNDQTRWDGNLKKFRFVADGGKLVIADQSLRDAIDPRTGFFRNNSQSFWSAPPADGNRVTSGGAVSKLPNDRSVLTFLGENPAGTATDLIAITNESVTDAVLGTGTNPTRQDVLNFARSVDSKRMGDPLHSEPAVVTFGGTPASPVDYVFVATNDGFLHAFNAADGREQWAFVPKELLARLKELYISPAVTQRSYGLDGDIRVLRLDRDSDGQIERADGDRVWLYVGMRRGGSHYYALDVTDPTTPKMLFSIGPGQLPGIGETWSAPTIARVDVEGVSTQNNQDLVLIFGGGYDGVQENYTQADDAVGNRIFMVDAKSGELLWFAGGRVGEDDPPEATKWLEMPDMKNSIPSEVRVIDTNGDLYADRMYVGDMGGRVFRFDIFSGEEVDNLVRGGVFASLGQGGAAEPSIADTRRFYNAPDVALVQRRGEDPYYNVAIGSGYRGHPLHKETVDRFYSLRDKIPFSKLTDYSDLAPITDTDDPAGDLVDVTINPSTVVVPTTAKGWKLRLLGSDGTGSGEKVLAESTTVNGVILFSTYEPTEATTDPCIPSSLNRVYAVSVDSGKPALDLDRSGQITDADRYERVAAQGILGQVNVGLLRGRLAEDLGAAPGGAQTVCLAGMHVLGTCVQVSDTVRTFWRKDADRSDD